MTTLGSEWDKLVGATSATYVVPVADVAYDGFQYICEVKDMYGNVAYSEAVVLYIVAQPEVPDTGDSANLQLWSALLLLSLAGCLGLARRKYMLK